MYYVPGIRMSPEFVPGIPGIPSDVTIHHCTSYRVRFGGGNEQ